MYRSCGRRRFALCCLSLYKACSKAQTAPPTSMLYIMSNQTDVLSLNTTDHQTKANDNWGNDWVITCRTYLLPILTLSGILINVASVVVLMKKRIRLKRALTKFFAFLNISDM